MLSTSSRGALRLRAQIPPRITSVRHAHGPAQYNEPTGWLFGEKPPPPGQKRQKEEWETLWYVGMFGGMMFAAVGLYYKPDTSINNWALKEAKRRMEEKGESVEYKPS